MRFVIDADCGNAAKRWLARLFGSSRSIFPCVLSLRTTKGERASRLCQSRVDVIIRKLMVVRNSIISCGCGQCVGFRQTFFWHLCPTCEW